MLKKINFIMMSLIFAVVLFTACGDSVDAGDGDGDGQYWMVSTLAGSISSSGGGGGNGYQDGQGSDAWFNYPEGVAVDSAGNVYVADRDNNRIRKITSGGMVSLFAGSGTAGYYEGAGASAQFNKPTGVAVYAGDVYVADRDNNRIRKINSVGMVSLFAGDGTATQFNKPTGVAVDSAGNVYVADSENHRIRKITSGGTVTLFAGSGTAGYNEGAGATAQFNKPTGVAVDSSGNVYVADSENHRIRKINSGGTVILLAGSGTAGSNDGTGASAQFNKPTGVAVDSAGNVYVADCENNKIRKIDSSGTVSTIAGTGYDAYTDGAGPNARFKKPWGITVNSAVILYVADSYSNAIRKITPPAP